MPRVLRVLCSLLLVGWVASAQTLSREQALADLDFVITKIDAIHPDPYAIRSRDQLTAERKRIADALPPTLTASEMWMLAAPLVAGYGDGHTGLSLPGNAGPRFPATFLLIEEQLVVIDSAFHDLEIGERLLRINGHDVQELLSQWQLAMPGELDHARRAAAAADFPWLLQMQGIPGPYEVAVSGADSNERNVTVPAIPAADLGRVLLTEIIGSVQKQPASMDQTSPGFAFKRLSSDAGYLVLYTFALEKADRFEKDLKRIIGQLTTDHAETLIIDVRGNNGGLGKYVTTLLMTFAKHPFEDPQGEWKVSEAARSRQYRGWARAIGLDQILKPSGGLSSWSPKKHKPKPTFTGNVCILADSASYSAAIRLADMAQHYKFATIVGEETGGTANMHGNTIEVELPNSHLPVSIASARFWRANGERGDRTGVRPDIVVAPTIADVAAGRDPVLERALDCPATPR